MRVDCMGGWCTARESCSHYASYGPRIVDRLCAKGQQDCFHPVKADISDPTEGDPVENLCASIAAHHEAIETAIYSPTETQL